MFYSLMRRINLVWKQIERGWGLISKNLSVPIFFYTFTYIMYILLKKSRHPIPHPHPHPRSEAYYTNVKINNEEKSQKNGIQLFEFQSFKTC